PVVGDTKYGDAETNKRFRARGFRRMFLHASSLTLPHPNGDTLSVSAPLDDELRDLLTELEGGPR
ncbi:MAG: 23S rRNA pseudouridine(955/2504/2580) synthase, partial [Xanthomonadaceae bacterium]|nr:23S rRNA pseudouridine(955/2504/2580) synthase [Xanthomonadaceae bacterium]